MITAFTKFETVDDLSATELEILLTKLSKETIQEKGFIAYDVLSEKDFPRIYYVIEKWQSEEDLNNHSELVAEKGYATQAVHLLQNEINTILLNNLNK
ncbi:putative quinol monooxygenase [Chryseobacterium balustinum]|jgi:quinol monooxygenase YgiN|uniref:putative quinol monooxygenase n=1 Tax=Chryseobacterium balustinum TaxID=246 RepID=UPI003CF22711